MNDESKLNASKEEKKFTLLDTRSKEYNHYYAKFRARTFLSATEIFEYSSD